MKSTYWITASSIVGAVLLCLMLHAKAFAQSNTIWPAYTGTSPSWTGEEEPFTKPKAVRPDVSPASQCRPNTAGFGYNETQWRQWPLQPRPEQRDAKTVGGSVIPAPPATVPKPLPYAEGVPSKPSTPGESPGGNILPLPGATIIPGPGATATPGTIDGTNPGPIGVPAGPGTSLPNVLGNSPADSNTRPKTESKAPGGDFFPPGGFVPLTPDVPTDKASPTPGNPAAKAVPTPDTPAAKAAPALETSVPPTTAPFLPPSLAPSPPTMPSPATPGPATPPATLPGPATLPDPVAPPSTTLPTPARPTPATPSPSAATEPMSPTQPIKPAAPAPRRNDAVAAKAERIPNELPMQADWNASLEPEAMGDNRLRSASLEQRVGEGFNPLRCALGGYCPVLLQEQEEWIAGSPDYPMAYQGQVFHFSSDAARKRFEASPEKYAPVQEGNDVVLAADDNRTVPGNVNHSAVWHGRLYLFSDTATLAKFQHDPRRYAEHSGQASLLSPTDSL